MAFKPLGYAFEVTSPLPPEKLKSVIRERKKGWLDSKDGPRGWILGPLMCLWMSAFDRHGPMVIALIQKGSFGSRVAGRAGADLNGMALFLLLTPLMAWVTWQMHQAGQGTTRAYLAIGAIFGLGLPLTLWLNSQDRKHADPLVRFIRNTVTVSGQSLRAKAASATISPQVRMTVNGEDKQGSVTAEAIHDALLNAGVGDSVILATGAESYVQTLVEPDGFILEKREGDRHHHYRGCHRGNVSESRTLFTFEDVLATLMAYGTGSLLPDTVAWEPMDLPK